MTRSQSVGVEYSTTRRGRLARSGFVLLASSIACIFAPIATLRGGDGAAPTESPTATPAGAKPNFDKVGPQVGDQLPDLKLRTIKGEPQRLGDAWRGGPALLVTSSFTCPKSRSRWPEAKAIVDKYGDKLNVVIVYVIEAHPVGSVCPYKGVEEVTPENQRDNILRHQPQTLDDRLDLAQEFKRYLRVAAPIYVDTLNNQAWKALGAAPNIAYLVDTGGSVVARQSWFEGEGMEKSIGALLNKAPASKLNRRPSAHEIRDNDAALEESLTAVGGNTNDLRRITSDKNIEKLAEVLKKVPTAVQYIFRSQQGHSQETTWLMEAIADSNPAAAELLLEHGASVSAATRSFDSALQQAAGIGQAEIVKLLLSHHADVNYPATGRTPLHEALLAQHADIVQLLIAGGAKPDFFSDVALGKVAAVRKSLADDPSRTLRPDGAGRLPLDYAAASGQLEIAGLLLASGAPVVDDDLSRSRVPLHYAIDTKNVAMVELLLKAGSSPNTALGFHGDGSSQSEPPLQMAIWLDDVQIVKLLLAYKADLTRRNTYSQTPLHVAAEFGKPVMVKLLVDAGADVNARQLRFDLPCGSGEEETPSQNTPLHFAAARGNPATIKLLYDSGAQIDAVNVNGLTPLMSTIEPPLYTGVNEESQLANLKALLAAGASVNLRDKEGRTALDLATTELVSESAREKPIADRIHAIQALIDVLKEHGARPGEPPKK